MLHWLVVQNYKLDDGMNGDYYDLTVGLHRVRKFFFHE